MNGPKSARHEWFRIVLVIAWLYFAVFAFIDNGIDSQFDLVYGWLILIAYILLKDER